MKTIAFVTLLWSVLLLLGGCTLLPALPEPSAPELLPMAAIHYETVTPVRRELAVGITCTGRFSALSQQELNFGGNTGTLTAVYIQTGDTLEKGQPLAALHTESRDISVVITAPMAGRVAFLYNAAVGDTVNGNTVFITLIKPESVFLACEGENLSAFAQGISVQIAFRNRLYTGSVVYDAQHPPIDLPERLAGCALVALPAELSNWSLGDKAAITLVTGQKQDALTVPASAVTFYAGRHYVQVLENGSKADRAVQIGLENGEWVEILSGLDETSLVIVP